MMAYVPDEAIDNQDKLTPAARSIFFHFCRWRDRETGFVWGRQNEVGMICEALGLKKSQFYAARAELMNLGWVQVVNGQFRPVFGFPENRNDSEKPESEFRKIGKIPENRKNSRKSESEIPENRKIHSEKPESPPGPPYKDISSSLMSNVGDDVGDDAHVHAREVAQRPASPPSSVSNSVLKAESPEPYAAKIYREITDLELTPYQTDLIRQRAPDLARWRAIVEFAAANGWKCGRITNLLKAYDEGVNDPQAPVGIQSATAKQRASERSDQNGRTQTNQRNHNGGGPAGNHAGGSSNRSSYGFDASRVKPAIGGTLRKV